MTWRICIFSNQFKGSSLSKVMPRLCVDCRFLCSVDPYWWWIFSKAKPSQNAPTSGTPVLEKPIMLMKARDDGGKPGTPPEAAAQSSGPGPSKMEREGQRPTQPVYQIQNRGMGASAPSSALDRESLQRLRNICFLLFSKWGESSHSLRHNYMCIEKKKSFFWFPAMVGQSKLLPPEKMKHSIKLVDDQMNWCDSAMEVSWSRYLMNVKLYNIHTKEVVFCPDVFQYLRDQTDMLVVGVIGLQGTGKSTIMSLLSANTPEEDQR